MKGSAADEEKHRKDQVNGGKHHVVDDGLDLRGCRGPGAFHRSEEHTSELQSP